MFDDLSWQAAGGRVQHAGTSLLEGGWWEPSDELEPPLGGGLGGAVWTAPLGACAAEAAQAPREARNGHPG